MNYKSPAWQRLRQKVLQRDNFTCKSCGAKNCQLQVHHTSIDDYRSDFDYLNADLEDLETLCARCHKAKHSIGEHYRPHWVELRRGNFYINGTGATCKNTGKILAYHTIVVFTKPAKYYYLAIDEECLDILKEKGQPAMLDFEVRNGKMVC